MLSQSHLTSRLGRTCVIKLIACHSKNWAQCSVDLLLWFIMWIKKYMPSCWHFPPEPNDYIEHFITLGLNTDLIKNFWRMWLSIVHFLFADGSSSDKDNEKGLDKGCWSSSQKVCPGWKFRAIHRKRYEIFNLGLYTVQSNSYNSFQLYANENFKVNLSIVAGKYTCVYVYI